jgi:hypothetical protein
MTKDNVEPVAWIDSVMEQAQVFASAWSLVGGTFDSGNGMKNAEEEQKALRAMLAAQPAAQRQWIGLTDEELFCIYNQNDWNINEDWNYERAIEAKLKEKNT